MFYGKMAPTRFSLATALVALALVVTWSGTPASNAMASPGLLKTAPCRMGQSRAAAICGTLTVFEDRAAKSGRTIDIHFVIVQAKEQGARRAIAFNPGGPGASAIADASDFADAAGAMGTLRATYDLLFVDNRGTGTSAPQTCDLAPAGHPELYYRDLWPETLVRSCHDRLAAQANLSLYSTSEAADDLDDVRAALGYPKLVLFGGSYGTRFYLDYARRHPERVESIVLEGVAPPHFYIIPLPMALGAQTAIENLAQACRRDATCFGHFPHFRERFVAVAQRFDAGPVTLTVQNPVTHRPQAVQLTKVVFAETIRHAMYFPPAAAYIPVTIERAYRGDYKPLGEMVGSMAALFSNIVADGLNLSVTCAEDLPFITEADIARSSAGTFEGDARVRAQQRACKLWNVEPVPSSFVEPVRSDAPILMISGTDDPATPPQYAREALPFLPHARMMLVPGASHGSDFPPCVDATIVAFVKAGSSEKLSFARCAATYKRPAFVALAYDEPAAGEDRAQTQRFTTLVDDILQGRLDRSQLTPALSKQLPNAEIKGLASGFDRLGRLQAIVFKGASRSSKGRAYTYLLRFTQGNVTGTLVVDSSKRIADLDFSE